MKNDNGEYEEFASDIQKDWTIDTNSDSVFMTCSPVKDGNTSRHFDIPGAKGTKEYTDKDEGIVQIGFYEFLILIFDENNNYVDSMYTCYWAQCSIEKRDGKFVAVQKIPIDKEFSGEAEDVKTHIRVERPNDPYLEQMKSSVPTSEPDGVGGSIVADGSFSNNEMPENERKALEGAANKWNKDKNKTNVSVSETGRVTETNRESDPK